MRLFAAAVGLLVSVESGCTVWRTTDVPPKDLFAAKTPWKVRVTVLRPGTVWKTLELTEPRIEGDSLVNTTVDPWARPGFTGKPAKRNAIALSDIARLEVHEISRPRTIALIAAGAIVTASIVAGRRMMESWHPLGSPASRQ